MLEYVLRRAVHSAFALFALLLLVFFLSRLTGDPASVLLPVDATPQQRAEFAAHHGLDQPLYVQIARYVRGLAELDFGTSLRQQRPAIEPALEAWPTTLKLSAVTMLVAIPLALMIGALAAYRPGKLFDRVSTVLSLAAASAPAFWAALIALLVLGVSLRWLPTSGMGTPLHWVLPVGILVLRPLGLLTQVLRGTMVGEFSSAYVKTARAKGVAEPDIIFGHVLRNSLLPMVSVAGALTTSLVNGAVIVETIFGWPGMGALLLNAILERDFAVIQACVLLTAITIFTLNILIDVLYSTLDPRIRYR